MTKQMKRLGTLCLLLMLAIVSRADGFKDFSVIVNNQDGTLLTADEQVQGTAINFGVAVTDDGTVRRLVDEDLIGVATISGNYHSEHGCTNLKVVVPNGKNLLRPGMYVTTTIGLGKATTIVVPYQAVEKLVGANDRYVFINEGGRAKRVAVELGQRFDQEIEIIAPEIKDGVEMVTTGQHKLVDGVKINVVKD